MIKSAILLALLSTLFGVYLYDVQVQTAPSRRRRLLEQTHSEMPSDPVEKWRPLNCPALLQEAYNKEIYDPNLNSLYARWTTTNPPFFIAMNNWWYDKMRKVIYDKGEYYEQKLTEIFINILKYSPPNARIVDVGGNIGWFTMVSAATGHHVDVFEPNKVNIIRQCQSMWLNGWENAAEREIVSRTTKQGSVNIRPYGVGSNTTTMQIFMGNNPGKATMQRDMLPAKKKPKTATINIVTLDSLAIENGWLDGKTPIVILKVDVEGFEPSVFAGAKKLLSAGLIQNILMEVTGQDDNAENAAMLRLIMKSGYYLHNVGGPEGPSKKSDLKADDSLPDEVLSRFAKRKGMQTNLWWKWDENAQNSNAN